MSRVDERESAVSIEGLAGKHEDDIDLMQLVRAVWAGRWLIIASTLIFAFCSVFYALSISDEYESTAILIPASSSNSSSLSGLAGQFGGLASLAGVNLGGVGGDKASISMKLLLTWGFLEAFIKENQLEVEVFAVNGWDKKTNTLKMNEAVFDDNLKEWISEVSDDGGGIAMPTSWQLFEKMEKRISVSQDAKTGMVSLSVEHYSPYIAKKWADLLVVAINRHMQEQDKTDALNSIEYLKRQIGKTNIAEMRTIFYQLIEEQTKTLMLAEISDEYVFKTLSSAKIAEQKVRPKRALIVILGTMLGCVLAVLILLFWHLATGGAVKQG